MQQEMGLIRAQLNLIQQTLNVVLEKLDRLEDDKREREKQELIFLQQANNPRPINALESRSSAFPIPSPSHSLPSHSNNFNNLHSPHTPNKYLTPREASRQQEENPAESSSYFEDFITRAIQEANPKQPESSNANISSNSQRVRTCIECKQVKQIAGQNKCNSCYMRSYHKEKKQKAPQRQCISCGEEKELKTKDQCRNCYYKDNTPVKRLEKCIDCGQLRKLSAVKKCHPCYMKLYHRVRKNNLKKYLKVCKACRLLKPHYAHGKCEPCYMLTRKDKRDVLEATLNMETNHLPQIEEHPIKTEPFDQNNDEINEDVF